MDYAKYNDIRPLLPEEVPAAIQRLLANEDLRKVYESLGTPPSWEELGHILKDCRSVNDFKAMFSAKLVYFVMKHTCQAVAPLQGLEHLSKGKAYTYISNHRDIILDSAFLNVLLHDAGFDFPEIAIGDNLLVSPWVEELVKLNGNFLVRRNLQGREVLLAAKQLSAYMNDALASGIPLWIAQREGRAKDSNDRTQPALLKMLSLSGGKRGIVDNLKNLNIVPLTCSYEYDPCDYLKAREMQLKRDMPDYKKTKAEDALNMKTGVLGNKGHVTFTMGRPLNTLLEGYLFEGIEEGRRAEVVADIMDREIHRNYTLYPINYIACDRLSGQKAHSDKYTAEDEALFDKYIQERISLIEMPLGYDRDDTFLTARLLEMYANPTINHLRSTTNH